MEELSEEQQKWGIIGRFHTAMVYMIFVMVCLQILGTTKLITCSMLFYKSLLPCILSGKVAEGKR